MHCKHDYTVLIGVCTVSRIKGAFKSHLGKKPYTTDCLNAWYFYCMCNVGKRKESQFGGTVFFATANYFVVILFLPLPLFAEITASASLIKLRLPASG